MSWVECRVGCFSEIKTPRRGGPSLTGRTGAHGHCPHRRIPGRAPPQAISPANWAAFRASNLKGRAGAGPGRFRGSSARTVASREVASRSWGDLASIGATGRVPGWYLRMIRVVCSLPGGCVYSVKLLFKTVASCSLPTSAGPSSSEIQREYMRRLTLDWNRPRLRSFPGRPSEIWARAENLCKEPESGW
jgi:hypothetical protein